MKKLRNVTRAFDLLKVHLVIPATVPLATQSGDSSRIYIVY
jgi:hypothetical protein